MSRNLNNLMRIHNGSKAPPTYKEMGKERPKRKTMTRMPDRPVLCHKCGLDGGRSPLMKDGVDGKGKVQYVHEGCKEK